MAFLVFLILMICYPPLGIFMLIIGMGASIFKNGDNGNNHGRRRR